MNTQIVANTILRLSFESVTPISPMKLQKLMYFVYKYHLKTYNRKLFNEPFEKWKYGPVLCSIYYEFNSYGANYINKFARDAQGEVKVLDMNQKSDAARSISVVWKTYSSYTAAKLSELTHQKGSAWDKANVSTGYILKDEDIIDEPNYE